MTHTGMLKVTAIGEREIAITRDFAAPRRLVFDAYTKPELVRRWLLGPNGWSMPVCEIDLRVGGAYRYVWRHLANGAEMGMGGVYREIAAPERLVATEKFDESWYPGEAVNTLTLVERAGRTALTQTMRYESREARDAVLKSPMEQGLAAGFDRLAALLTSEPDSMKNPTTVARQSERELVVTRTFNGPAHIVFEAWTKPELFKRWWVPQSLGLSLLSCEMDVRTGGTYRLEFRHASSPEPVAFFGRYIEVAPHSRIVWTNEESADGPVSTVTFEEKDGKTLLVLTELYPSKQALDEAIASGSTATSGASEQFELLDELLVTLVRS